MITGYRFTNLTYQDVPFMDLSYDRTTDGHTVRNVEGLTPSNAVLTSDSSRYLPGTRVSNIRAEAREVVITFGLNPHSSESVHELRTKLHQLFVPGSKINFRVKYREGDDRHIDGYVETHEANVYSEEPLIQVKLYCPHPYYTTDTQGYYSIGAFNSNGSKETPDITLDSDVEVPIVFELVVGSTFPTASRITGFNLAVASRIDGEFAWRRFIMNLPTTVGLRRNDTLIVDSTIGAKFIERRRTGAIVMNLLPYVDSSRWPSFAPGRNRVMVTLNTNGTAANINACTIRYNRQYVGA